MVPQSSVYSRDTDKLISYPASQQGDFLEQVFAGPVGCLKTNPLASRGSFLCFLCNLQWTFMYTATSCPKRGRDCPELSQCSFPPTLFWGTLQRPLSLKLGHPITTSLTIWVLSFPKNYIQHLLILKLILPRSLGCYKPKLWITIF